MKTKILALLVPLFLFVTLIINWLATTGALNGIDTGQISDKYPVLFTPASYVFSIWSLIYLGLLAFSVFQLLKPRFSDASYNQTRILFLVNLVLNSIWIIAWHYDYLLVSLLIMVGLLLTLIGIYQTESIGQKPVDRQRKWLVHAPFSLYLGWISVATIANAAIVLYSLKWNGFGIAPIHWTIIMMVVATILGVISLKLRRDYIFAGVIVWALIGIGVKNGAIQPILTTAIITAGLLGLDTLATGLMHRQSPDNSET